MNLGVILAVGVLFAAGLAFGKAASSVRVVNDSELVKRVFVDGREYLVTRFPGGLYTVLLVKNPSINVTFNQTEELMRNGDSVSLKQLDADMKRFPNDLFKEALTK